MKLKLKEPREELEASSQPYRGRMSPSTPTRQKLSSGHDPLPHRLQGDCTAHLCYESEEPVAGYDPATFSLRVKRSTNWSYTGKAVVAGFEPACVRYGFNA